MRLLVVTQAVDEEDPILGFFTSWIAHFARTCDGVEVIALRVGRRTLPSSVHIHSLGKEDVVSSYTPQKNSIRATLSYMITHNIIHDIVRRVVYVLRFYRLIWRLRRHYDAVFVHMNPEYAVLGGILWRVLGKKVSLWYTHKSVTRRLRAAVLFSHKVFTASEESMRLRTRKRVVVGHGIDTDVFAPREGRTEKRREISCISPGRISRIKHYEVLIEAVQILKKSGIDVTLTLTCVADTPDQKMYMAELEELVEKLAVRDRVTFIDPVPHARMPDVIRRHHVFLSASDTGSLDKIFLEAMSSCVIPVTSNEACRRVLGATHDRLMFQKRDASDLAKKIERVWNLDQKEKEKITRELRGVVIAAHSISSCVGRITQELSLL